MKQVCSKHFPCDNGVSISLTLLCLQPDVDKLMELGGYKNRASAQSMVSYIMKQVRNAIEVAQSGQANGAASTEAGPADSKTSPNKTGKASSSSKRAPKQPKIKAEPGEDLFGPPDLETNIEPKQTSTRKVKDKDTSKKRKSAKDDKNNSNSRTAEQSANSDSWLSSARIPGAQLAFISHQSSSSQQACEKSDDDKLESHVNSEPAHKKQKKAKARQDTPFNRPASDEPIVDQPSPTRPSPDSMQKLDNMLKYNDHFAETEQQRFMREQASIDFYGLSDEEIGPLTESGDNGEASSCEMDRSGSKLREDTISF
jgi:hypothetical protein